MTDLLDADALAAETVRRLHTPGLVDEVRRDLEMLAVACEQVRLMREIRDLLASKA